MSTTATTLDQAPKNDGGLSTLNSDGSRRWLRPRPSRGRFWVRRRALAYLLIAVFTLIPYLRLHGKPLVLIDIVRREFTILGLTILPTDTALLALLMIGIFVGVFLLTAVLGRVWCGWACPQTVYMEFVFRPIERLLEGEPGKCRPLLGDAAVGRAVKYVLYLFVSMFLAHTFLAYFVGVDELLRWVQRSPLDHPTSFLTMAAVTGLMLFDFGFFREQMCIVACPYGRFQSVLLDRVSLVVGYDRARGEPRGKLRKDAKKAARKGCCSDCKSGVGGRCNGDGEHHDEGGATGTLPGGRLALPFLEVEQEQRRGDCIDCRMCVQTCPTGIDIRSGLQMECIHCAQCIDACDAVMTKIGKPTGLIRYGSQAGMEGESVRRLRPRMVLYPAVLAVIATLFTIVLLSRGAADVSLVRGPGMPFNELEDHSISNPVRLNITNRTRRPGEFRVEIGDHRGRLVLDENPLRIAPGEKRSEPGLIVMPRGAFRDGHCEARVRITGPEGFEKDVRYRLLGPWWSGPEHRDESEKHETDGHKGDEH